MEGFLDKRKLENETSFKEVLHVLDEAYNLFSLRFCWSDMIETTNAKTRRKDYDELQNHRFRSQITSLVSGQKFCTARYPQRNSCHYLCRPHHQRDAEMRQATCQTLSQ